MRCQELLQFRVDNDRRLLMGVMTNAGNAHESTARRVTMAAFNWIIQHVRISAASQV